MVRLRSPNAQAPVWVLASGAVELCRCVISPQSRLGSDSACPPRSPQGCILPLSSQAPVQGGVAATASAITMLPCAQEQAAAVEFDQPVAGQPPRTASAGASDVGATGTGNLKAETESASKPGATSSGELRS